jgi:hypothetical protein
MWRRSRRAFGGDGSGWRTNVYGELQTDKARLETISKRGIRPRPSIEKGMNEEGTRRRRRGCKIHDGQGEKRPRFGGSASNSARRRIEGEDLSSAEKVWERRTRSPGREEGGGESPMAQSDGRKGQAMAKRRRGAASEDGRARSKRVSGAAVLLTRRVVCGGRWRDKKLMAGDEIE